MLTFLPLKFSRTIYSIYLMLVASLLMTTYLCHTFCCPSQYPQILAAKDSLKSCHWASLTMATNASPIQSTQNNNSCFGHVEFVVWNLWNFVAQTWTRYVFQPCSLLNSLGYNHCISKPWPLLMLTITLPSIHGHQQERHTRGPEWVRRVIPARKVSPS